MIHQVSRLFQTENSEFLNQTHCSYPILLHSSEIRDCWQLRIISEIAFPSQKVVIYYHLCAVCRSHTRCNLIFQSCFIPLLYFLQSLSFHFDLNIGENFGEGEKPGVEGRELNRQMRLHMKREEGNIFSRVRFINRQFQAHR